jgi:two-component system, OmpR family, response regulator
MRSSAVVFLVVGLVISALIVPVAGAEPVPDYGKILTLHLRYEGTGYSVSSTEVRYGKAPDLMTRGGSLRGIITDGRGTILREIPLRDPGIAYGDILGPPESRGLTGYTARPATGEIVIIAPFEQGMQKFSLIDSRDGSTLASADLTSTVALFCTDYPADPDCLVMTPGSETPVRDPGTYLALATLFSASVLLAAGLAIWTLRLRSIDQAPRQQVVLIVDDDPDIVSILEIFLKIRNYAVLTAPGGQDCLAILKNHVPDLILLDIMMEPMDGWETLEQIKKDPGTKTIPVLMLTGKMLTVDEARQYRICIDDYIMKPFQMDELFAAIDNVVSRRGKLRESLELGKKAGIEREKFCELALVTRRISVNKKILDLLRKPEIAPLWNKDPGTGEPDIIRQISRITRIAENRASQLLAEINSELRAKGHPAIEW